MNIFSLTHLKELEKELPDPKKACAEEGYSAVIRLPVEDQNAARHTGHLVGGIEAVQASDYVEFEIMMCKDTEGMSSPRWVLRGLVAM